MKMLLVFIACIGIVGCGQGFKGNTGPAGPKGPAGPEAPTPVPPVVDEEQVDIDFLIDDENDYRLGLGQAAITSGLSCSVIEIVSGSWLSTTSPGYPGSGLISTTGKTSYPYLYKGNFNKSDGLSTSVNTLLPSNLRSTFDGKNFKISCSGFIVVRDTDYYDFSLDSDDGSILTVDGVNVIVNDGNHGMTVKSGTKFLRRGIRSFSISYAQSGGGNYGLVLKAGGTTIDGKYYAH